MVTITSTLGARAPATAVDNHHLIRQGPTLASIGPRHRLGGASVHTGGSWACFLSWCWPLQAGECTLSPPPPSATAMSVVLDELWVRFLTSSLHGKICLQLPSAHQPSLSGRTMWHPKISISECEPFSKRNANFLKDFIYFHLKSIYLNFSLI
jgi:hypothetical protein